MDLQKRAIKTSHSCRIHSCRITCERSESARERSIALYKSNHHHHHHHRFNALACWVKSLKSRSRGAMKLPQTPDTIPHPRRFNALAAKREKWNGTKPLKSRAHKRVERAAGTAMCQCATSAFEGSFGCIVLDMPDIYIYKESEQTNRRTKEPSQMACISEDQKC